MSCDCGSEDGSPEEDVPPLTDEETLVYAVRDYRKLVEDGAFLRLGPAAFRKEDVQAKKPGKSVSLVRERCISKEKLFERVVALTKEETWLDTPVVARALSSRLRKIANKKFSKCTCLYADPIIGQAAELDVLGECKAHASLKKHCSFSAENDPEAWINLLSDLAECFSEPVYFQSGVPVVPR